MAFLIVLTVMAFGTLALIIWTSAGRSQVGRRRLRYGFCPLCNSSPPRPDCPVCEGDRLYGSLASAEKRAVWSERWEALR